MSSVLQITDSPKKHRVVTFVIDEPNDTLDIPNDEHNVLDDMKVLIKIVLLILFSLYMYYNVIQIIIGIINWNNLTCSFSIFPIMINASMTANYWLTVSGMLQLMHGISILILAEYITYSKNTIYSKLYDYFTLPLLYIFIFIMVADGSELLIVCKDQLETVLKKQYYNILVPFNYFLILFILFTMFVTIFLKL